MWVVSQRWLCYWYLHAQNTVSQSSRNADMHHGRDTYVMSTGWVVKNLGRSDTHIGLYCILLAILLTRAGANNCFFQSVRNLETCCRAGYLSDGYRVNGNLSDTVWSSYLIFSALINGLLGGLHVVMLFRWFLCGYYTTFRGLRFSDQYPSLKGLRFCTLTAWDLR